MITEIPKKAKYPCPDCGESRDSQIINKPEWLECKTCGYVETMHKGPLMHTRTPVAERIKPL